MDKATKEVSVGEIKESLKNPMSVVLADYRGITVPDVTALRDAFRKENCHYKVLKNTLVKIAIKGSKLEPMSVLLKGPTAVIWSDESPSTAAKIAVKYAAEIEPFKIKGGFFEGSVLDAAGVASLATMPGKDEVRASMLMTFLAAPTDFVRTLAAGPTNFLYVLQARERALK